jgi:uncharacterized SAM-dependent methyltransferase/DNA-binding XRE family transcriptional regulator
MTRRKLASEGIPRRLKTTRKAAGLTQRRTGELAGVSASTTQMAEMGGGRFPCVDTVERLAYALGVSAAWLAFGDGPASTEFHWWVDPALDAVKMHNDVAALLQGQSAHIEQSYIYVDTAGASNWISYVKQGDYAATVDSMPLREVAKCVAKQLSGQQVGLDVIGLGAGTAHHEVRLLNHLLSVDYSDIRLFLLDISHALLSIGYRHAVDALSHCREVSIWAMVGDFHRLPNYLHVIRSPEKRRRLFTMFGYTFGNLYNEIKFIQNNLSAASYDDLLLLDVTLVRAPVAQAQKLLASEPALSGHRPADFNSRLEEFITEPIRRHLSGIGTIKVKRELNLSACTVPESYAVDMKAVLPDGRQFSVAYVKRYTIESLAARLAAEGWKLIHEWQYAQDFNPSVLALFKFGPR